MKKLLIIICLTLGIVALLFCVKRIVNVSPPNSLTLDAQAALILDQGNCLMCHQEMPDLPFYASFPIIGKILTTEAAEALSQIDLSHPIALLKDGLPIGEVAMTKIEKAVTDGSMPPHSFDMVHWKSTITAPKREVMLAWAASHRSKYYYGNLSAASFANEPVQPVPDSIPTNPAKVRLGEQLFHDTRLSADNTVSCATCHDLATAGVDNEDVSEGINGLKGTVNAPTVFNAAFNIVQFWDGRAATLAEQAAGPPVNPVEMGCASFDEIIGKLQQDKAFSTAFLEVYPQGITEATLTDAIGEFEKTLLTPNAPFDRYLKGDATALSAQQMEGYALFKQYECATCHVGVYMGGQSFEKMGLAFDYFTERNTPLTEEDSGRFNITGTPRDQFRFKVPGLRNIALTSPYFHDASAETLEEAVAAMARYQAGITLAPLEKETITAFLLGLTGEYKGIPLQNKNLMGK